MKYVAVLLIIGPEIFGFWALSVEIFCGNLNIPAERIYILFSFLGSHLNSDISFLFGENSMERNATFSNFIFK